MNPTRMQPQYLANRLVRTAVCSVLLALCAASCGQRGPLFLPTEGSTAGGAPAAATQDPGASSENDDVRANEAGSLPKEEEEEEEDDEATS